MVRKTLRPREKFIAALPQLSVEESAAIDRLNRRVGQPGDKDIAANGINRVRDIIRAANESMPSMRLTGKEKAVERTPFTVQQYFRSDLIEVVRNSC